MCCVVMLRVYTRLYVCVCDIFTEIDFSENRTQLNLKITG